MPKRRPTSTSVSVDTTDAEHIAAALALYADALHRETRPLFRHDKPAAHKLARADEAANLRDLWRATHAELGFKLGAATGNAKARGLAATRPRLAASRAHWRQGIADGAFALAAFRGAYADGLRRDGTQP
jgi:hypothetical protein